MAEQVLIPYVNYFVVLDGDGSRLFAKYYDGKNKSEQQKCESLLHKKTKAITTKTDAEVLLMENEVVVLRSGNDCKFYISGSVEENELVLVGVLDALYETIYSLMRGQLDKRSMLDNLELVLLTIDEAIDSGNIMEMDPTAISTRVLMKASESSTQSQQALGDLSLSQALNIAKDQFFKTLTATRTDTY